MRQPFFRATWAGLQGGADERAHDRLDLDNTNCAVLVPHRDFPQQVQDGHLWGQYSKSNPRSIDLLRGILLVESKPLIITAIVKRGAP
jgi:hypothetical protein